MASLREPCSSAWILNQSAFVQDPVHLWTSIGRKKLTHSFPKACHSGDICKINELFTLILHHLHHSVL